MPTGPDVTTRVAATAARIAWHREASQILRRARSHHRHALIMIDVDLVCVQPGYDARGAVLATIEEVATRVQGGIAAPLDDARYLLPLTVTDPTSARHAVDHLTRDLDAAISTRAPTGAHAASATPAVRVAVSTGPVRV